jgi:hypothetical protein
MLDDQSLLVPCQQGLGLHGRWGHHREPVHAVPLGREGQQVTTLCRRPARRLAGMFDPLAAAACKRCAAKALGRTR